ncbi:MMPL family transporter [Embleya scabrispora]|uniref:MMPL family transporter n=1 Tax=Embleya scabrispora TaxID=159449 RepID=UPI00035C87E2|nr:MMPL family transporter [Embleya scabrispora]MYS87500.1 MMPL family transporter [Streptomyces sp. SID5474]
MATFLYRLGRAAFRRRRLVVLLWVAILALVGFGASQASAPAAKPFSVPGIEAQKAVDLLEARTPEAAAGGAGARIVFRAPAGQQIDSAKNKAAVLQVVGALKGTDQVASAADPFEAGTVSKDHTTAYAAVAYQEPADTLHDKTRDTLSHAAQQGRDAGLTVEVGGDALQTDSGPGNGEIVGVLIAAVVLAITFGAMIAAGLPLLTALLGVAIGVGGITALAGVFDLSPTTSTLAMMLGLAVGIDYALFVVSRYRSELTQGREPEDAAGRAVGTAGSAVVFAGLTVVVALAGLAVVNIPMLTEMGLAAAGTVAVAVLVALTFVPAILGFAGKRIFGRKDRKRFARREAEIAAGGTDHRRDADKPNMGTRWARFVLRRPIKVLVVAVLGLGALALPATSMELGLPDDSVKSTDTTQRRGYDLLTESFGPGFNGPLLVVVDAAKNNNGRAAAAEVTNALGKVKGIASIAPATFNKAENTAIIEITPASKPSSNATKDLVHAIRATADETKARTGADTLVGGGPALNIDFSQRLNDALLPYLALVVGLAILLLMAVFRSILVPLKAAGGFLLSVVASLGAVVAVFQWGWFGSLIGVDQTGPIMSMMPIFLVGIVFGLAMDYEVFLVTGMREAYVHGESPRQSVVSGFKHGARVVTAAALIMIGVFAGFIGAPDSMVKMIGFGLASAVLFDAFVVRMTIVPAVLALLGKSAWWLPAWLSKLIPNVDVEGEGLRKYLGDDAAAAKAKANPFDPADSDPDRDAVRV